MSEANWTLQKLLGWTETYLQGKDIPHPRLEAELLIGFAFKLKRVEVYTQFERPLQEEELQAFKILLKRRAAHEPLAYITGTKEFYGLNFRVTSAVLIPRPETELIVDLALNLLLTKNPESFRILDIGVGSGCILISILKNYPIPTGVGIDISSDALAIAQENAAFHGLLPRLQWFHRDFRDFETKLGAYDLIVANLPYISPDDWHTLQTEITEHEPKQALLANQNGLELIFEAFSKLHQWLKPGGTALFEIGAGQAEACRQKLLRFPHLSAKIHKDLSGIERMIEITHL